MLLIFYIIFITFSFKQATSHKGKYVVDYAMSSSVINYNTAAKRSLNELIQRLNIDQQIDMTRSNKNQKRISKDNSQTLPPKRIRNSKQIYIA